MYSRIVLYCLNKNASLKTALHAKREFFVPDKAKIAGILELYPEHFQRRPARNDPFCAVVSQFCAP